MTGWSGYYGATGPIGEINARINPDDYVLVFWTKDEPRVPALALAQKDWLTVDEVADALDALPAKAAVILDSCSSGRAFSGFHLNSKESKRIDFVLASAGFEQISNLNLARTVATFAEMFPGVPVPAEATHDQMVSPPLWLCVQVPSVADFTGEMSETPLYRKAKAK